MKQKVTRGPKVPSKAAGKASHKGPKALLRCMIVKDVQLWCANCQGSSDRAHVVGRSAVCAKCCPVCGGGTASPGKRRD